MSDDHHPRGAPSRPAPERRSRPPAPRRAPAVAFLAAPVASLAGTVPLALLSPVAVVAAVSTLLAALGALVARFLRGGDPDDRLRDGPASGAARPPDLTEDEQFVVDLLRRHDGRIRQSEIVEQVSWSKSKVSRLLSSMERDEYVEKVKIGRENVVVLTLPLEPP